MATVLAVLACGCASASRPLPDPTTPSAAFGGNLAGGSITDRDWRRIVEHTLDSVLLVENTGCGFTATGSGFVIAPRLVVTNRHVVEGAVTLALRARSGQRVGVTGWSYSTTDDLALVRATVDLPTRLPTSPDPTPGDLVVAVGYPLSGPQQATRGRVLTLRPDRGRSTVGDVITSTSPVLPGNSGGPLIDTTGSVTGVVFAIDLVKGATLAIPASRLAALLAGTG